MKTGARFHVMRFAPLIGRPTSPRRVTVAFNAWTLDQALVYARTRGAGPLWIQHRDQVAHLHRRTKGSK